VLTKVSEILKLRKEIPRSAGQCDCEASFFYADPEWRNGYLQDKRSAVYFDLSQTEVRPGQWVELTGETGPGGFAPEILNTLGESAGYDQSPGARWT